MNITQWYDVGGQLLVLKQPFKLKCSSSSFLFACLLVYVCFRAQLKKEEEEYDEKTKIWR